MSTRIALLRGINVGGKNILPMKDLVELLQALKLENVRTYIQSGNVVFDGGPTAAAPLGERISKSIEKQHGFKPTVLILSASQLRQAMKANPFRNAQSEPKTLHLGFLASPASQPDIESIEAAKAPSERFKLTDTVFYLHAPDGIGRSKLASKVERLLGVPVTGRNWRTVLKLSEMAASR